MVRLAEDDGNLSAIFRATVMEKDYTEGGAANAVAVGGNAVVATNNDRAWRAALELSAAGTTVTILDQRAELDPALTAAARAAGVAVEAGALLTRALGGRRTEGVEFRSAGAARERRIACDVVCVSAGWSPAVHLTSHTGIKPVYRDDIDAFVTRRQAEIAEEKREAMEKWAAEDEQKKAAGAVAERHLYEKLKAKYA